MTDRETKTVLNGFIGIVNEFKPKPYAKWFIAWPRKENQKDLMQYWLSEWNFNILD